MPMYHTVSGMLLDYIIVKNEHRLIDSIGFAVVGEYQDPKIKDAQKSAFEQMVTWLKAH